MNSITKLIMLFMIFGTFYSCQISRPISEQAAKNNKTYEISYLFEYDGCKVYRFYDQGNYVYFTNCKGEVLGVGRDSTKTRIINSIRN
ncbi:MAG: DUF4884 domain-containing protein [Saprospiraceae bacterium]